MAKYKPIFKNYLFLIFLNDLSRRWYKHQNLLYQIQPVHLKQLSVKSIKRIYSIMNNILISKNTTFFFFNGYRVLNTKSFSFINEFGLKTFNTGTVFSPKRLLWRYDTEGWPLGFVPQNNMEVLIVNNTKFNSTNIYCMTPT